MGRAGGGKVGWIYLIVYMYEILQKRERKWKCISTGPKPRHQIMGAGSGGKIL